MFRVFKDHMDFFSDFVLFGYPAPEILNISKKWHILIFPKVATKIPKLVNAPVFRKIQSLGQTDLDGHVPGVYRTPKNQNSPKMSLNIHKLSYCIILRHFGQFWACYIRFSKYDPKSPIFRMRFLFFFAKVKKCRFGQNLDLMTMYRGRGELPKIENHQNWV